MKLEDMDRDGALGEALETLHGSTRGAFLRRAASGAGRCWPHRPRPLRPLSGAATPRSSTTR